MNPGFCLSLSAAALAVCVSGPAAAATAAESADFAIEAGPLDDALRRFAAQSRLQLLYPASLVEGRRSAGVRGRLEGSVALDRLLAGTGLEWSETRPGVLVLRINTSRAAAAQDDPLEEPSTVEEVVVTGTLLRGAVAPASPLTVVTRDRIDAEGRGTVSEALAALPQVYGGSSTPVSLLTGADPLGTNSTAASGVNLRGLGADATLVLVNGRRLAGTGLKGDFADVSAVPLAAVERIDVLLDGASALYGSDAVGGVVNIILRRRFEGQETRLRASAARGGAEETILAHTAGLDWEGGNLVVSYERQDLNGLSMSDRDYTATGDLRPFGGSDRRTIFATPGNVVGLNDAGDDFVTRFAIRPPAGGTARTAADFVAGQTNLANDREGVSLTPDQERDSLWVSARQALNAAIEVSADLRYSIRRFGYDNFAPTALLTVRPSNPFYVSPDGAASQQIAYGFAREIGASRFEGEARSLGVTAGADVSLPRRWRLEVYGAAAEETSESFLDRQINSTFLNEALDLNADNPATPYSAPRDGFFNPFGAGAANTSAVLAFISSGYSAREGETQVLSGNLLASGPLFDLPGGAIELAVGGQIRSERFGRGGVNFFSGVTPRPSQRPRYDRSIEAVFAELRVPLVGRDNARPGLRRLELSAAARHERYDDAGETVTPKFGVIWSPVDGLRVRGTWGESFRAPALTELFDRPGIGPTFIPEGDDQRLVLLRTGGNAQLRPETATTSTLGVDWTPPALPGLTLNASVFDIDFGDRIGQPGFENLVSALSDPTIAPFVTRFDPAVPADLATIRALLADPAFSAPGLFPETAYSAVIDGRFVNTASVRIRGLDLSGAYAFERGADRFVVEATASYVADFDQALTPTAEAVSVVDTVGYPVDFRGRLSGTWTRGPASLRVGIDHVDGYRTRDGRGIDAWTTLDSQATWAPREGARLAGLALTLSVINLLDEEPPFYDSPQGVGFDAGQANPLGRVVSLQLTRRW